MEIRKNAAAGTLESSDVFICVEPYDQLSVQIQSVVQEQYMEAVSNTVYQVLEEFEIKSGKIQVNDRGALDCVIRARMETAIRRGGSR